MDLRGGTTIAGFPVWHAGNMGANSGLQSDGVRGYFLDTAANVNTIVLRDANGYIAANKFNNVVITDPGATNTTTLTIANSKTLTSNVSTTFGATSTNTGNLTIRSSDTNARMLTLAGSPTIGGAGTLTLTSDATFTTALTVNAGAVTLSAYSATGTSATLPADGAITLVDLNTPQTLTNKVINDIKATGATTAADLWSEITTGSITIGAGLTSGTFTLGATGSTGVVSLFPATGSQAITLGGATTGTITLGSTSAAAVQLPTGKTKIGTTILAQGVNGTVTLPSTAGTLVGSGDTGTVTNAMLAGSIANAKLSNSTISGVSLGGTLGTLSLGVSGTGLSGAASYNGSAGATFTVTSNATSANTASTIVARDGSGNFSAGTITAALSGNASTATKLETARNIYGNSFDGSVALTQIIASTYGGTGNGFTKFTGPTSAERTFTLPNADCTILTTNATVTIGQGGTGLTSYTAGDIIYASADNVLSKLAKGTDGKILKLASGVPSWATEYSYTHPTGDGNLHVPATSTTNDTKVLKAGSTAGSIAWGTVAFSEISSKPNTLAGYGITDASINTHTHAFADLTSKPTTLAGYGITDAATSTHTHTDLTNATSANTASTLVKRDSSGNFSAGTITAALSGTASTATNLIGGNATTLLGSIPYQSNTNITTLLSPNVTSTKKFLRMTGTGSNGAAPAWDTIVDGDIPDLTGKTYNTLSLTAKATGFEIAGGTASKKLTVSADATLDQSLSKTDWPQFSMVSVEGVDLTSSSSVISSSSRSTDGVGYNATLRAGPAKGTNQVGGTLTLESGSATGNASSDIVFKTATPGASGTSNTSSTERLVVNNNGIKISAFTAAGVVINASTGILSSTATLGTTYGGTGLNSYTAGDIIYASSTNTLSKLAKGTDGKILKLVSGAPSWETEYSYTHPTGDGNSHIPVTSTTNTNKVLIAGAAANTFGWGTIVTNSVTDKAVTYTKIQDVAALSILGNSNITAASVQALSASDVRALLNVADGANNYSLPVATSSVLGGVKPDGTTIANTSGAISVAKVPNSFVIKFKTGTTENTDLYTFDGSGAKTVDIKAGSNISLTAAANSITIANTYSYTHPSYTSAANGLYKVTVDGTGHVSATTAVTKADITGLGIPGSDTTYAIATASVAGLVKIGYTLSGRNYPVELSSDQMYVNVPWTDTVYSHPTYTSAANGLYKVTVDGTGHVSATTAVAKADITSLGIPGSDTTYSAGTGLTLSTTTFSLTDIVAGSGTTGALKYSGTTATAGALNGSSTAPSSTTRLNYEGYLYATRVYNAVWNDIADFITVDEDTKVEFGKVYFRDKNYKISTTKKYGQSAIGIASDTFGFGVGQSNKKQIPIAIGGWALAFTDKIYKPGTPLVATKHGTLTKAKWYTVILNSDRIVAYFDRPEYEPFWNGIEVNTRNWVKVKG